MEEAINSDLFVRNKRHEDCPEEANHSNKYDLVSNRDKIKVEKLDWCPDLPILDQNRLVVRFDSSLNLRD